MNAIHHLKRGVHGAGTAEIVWSHGTIAPRDQFVNNYRKTQFSGAIKNDA